ncbi:MAG: hypothetical protein AAGG56_06920 [Pseudomonadota bacterium]
MKPIHEEPAEYDEAVAKSAKSYLSRYGKNADTEAWKAARQPTMTQSEKAYCEAVAVKVTSELRKPYGQV